MYDCPGCFAQSGVSGTAKVINEQAPCGGQFWCSSCGSFLTGEDLDEAEDDVPLSIDVGIVTWPQTGFPQRLEYLSRVVAALFSELNGQGCDVRFTVSAEKADVNSYSAEQLKQFCDSQGLRLLWNEPPARLCRNMKTLIDACDRPYFFYMQDDWLLNMPINLAQDAVLLDDVDILRYRWVGRVQGIKMVSTLFEEISTKSNWFYAHNPFLAKRSQLLKLFPMMRSESQVNRQAKKSGLRVAVRRPSIFKHIGGQSVMTPDKKRPVEE